MSDIFASRDVKEGFALFRLRSEKFSAQNSLTEFRADFYLNNARAFGTLLRLQISGFVIQIILHFALCILHLHSARQSVPLVPSALAESYRCFMRAGQPRPYG